MQYLFGQRLEIHNHITTVRVHEQSAMSTDNDNLGQRLQEHNPSHIIDIGAIEPT